MGGPEERTLRDELGGTRRLGGKGAADWSPGQGGVHPGSGKDYDRVVVVTVTGELVGFCAFQGRAAIVDLRVHRIIWHSHVASELADFESARRHSGDE